MLALVVASLLSVACAVQTPPSSPGAAVQEPRAVIADSSYQSLFEAGVGIREFMDKAEKRKKQWSDNFDAAVVPDALLTRARASGGPWKLLVVAVDGCSDSVNTIPYLAKLAALVPGMELRIVNSTEGRWVMDLHRTADGRAATPTVVLLDASFQDRGCFIERPPELKTWFTGNTGTLGEGALFDGKMKWYDEDKGGRTIEEMVVVLEAAVRGHARCLS